jgi:hypothetical protein
MTIRVDKKEIRKDPFLRFCMKTGIPLSILAVLLLWGGGYLPFPYVNVLFVLATSLAIVIGLAYNVRFVTLSVRSIREQEEQAKKKK